jgi:hypothetical protein
VRIRLLVVALVVVSGCRRSVPPPTVSPGTDAERTAFAQEMAAALAPCDPKAIDALIDFDTLGRLAVTGAPNARAVLAGLLEKARGVGFGAQLCGAADQPTTIRQLGEWKRDGEVWPLYRSIGAGVNYVAFRPGKDAKGKVRAVDMYSFMAGQESSAVMRDLIDTLLERSASENSKLDQAMTKLRVATLAGKQDEARAILATMPAEVRAKKALMVQRVALSASLPPAEYQAALDEYAKLFPGDPSLDLIAVDGFWLRKDYPSSLAAIDRLDAVVGGDPYLDGLRAMLHDEAGDLDKALAAARSGVTREPELQPLWWFLLTVQLDRKEVAPALATIDELQTRFAVVMDEDAMRAEPKYGFLLASPAWKQRQAAAAEAAE